ncbi:hypothetical protein ACH4TQ_23310 [Streptomyces sp. NPDC021218]|uniref:hypothetical protein n=1 Tax=Streptomyces sp. NPDC021218 TaxID=3365119 RepID=UPI0037B6BC1A
MRATAVTPAAGTAAIASGTTPGYAATEQAGGHQYDPDSPRFSLAVLPDTQYLFDADSAFERRFSSFAPVVPRSRARPPR